MAPTLLFSRMCSSIVIGGSVHVDAHCRYCYMLVWKNLVQFCRMGLGGCGCLWFCVAQ